MRWRKLVFLLASFCLLCIIYSFIEPYMIRVNSFEFEDPDVPPSFDGKKIVFIADVHCGPLFSVARTRGLVERINGLNPDLIFLGGDYILDDVRYIHPCIGEFKGFEAPLGVYGVLGNHEHWADAEISRDALVDAGVTLVDNSAEWIMIGDDKVRIGGVGDVWEDVQDTRPTLDVVGEDDFVILLSHNPDYAEEIRDDKIDLMLAGHTHGGQVTFFGWWTPVKTTAFGEKYVSGMVDTGYVRVFVTNGVGMAGLPVRFFAPPEIVEITLRWEGN
jgi:predicted MPP superfamily phosphohydrolase